MCETDILETVVLVRFGGVTMPQKFIVDDAFWKIFPDVEIAFLTAHHVNNHDTTLVPTDLLTNANKIAATRWVPNEPISQNPVVQEWRTAFQKFKTKKGARCAVENLLKRAKNDKGVSQINPVVDIYNAVSLESAFPVAAEDMDHVIGDIHLTVAHGGEPFRPIGENDVEQALPGEIIYQDAHDVISRCWAWRDSARVEVTSETQNLLFYMENITPARRADHLQAVHDLRRYLKDYLNLDTTYNLVTQAVPAITFHN